MNGEEKKRRNSRASRNSKRSSKGEKYKQEIERLRKNIIEGAVNGIKDEDNNLETIEKAVDIGFKKAILEGLNEPDIYWNEETLTKFLITKLREQTLSLNIAKDDGTPYKVNFDFY